VPQKGGDRDAEGKIGRLKSLFLGESVRADR